MALIESNIENGQIGPLQLIPIKLRSIFVFNEGQYISTAFRMYKLPVKEKKVKKAQKGLKVKQQSVVQYSLLSLFFFHQFFSL